MVNGYHLAERGGVHTHVVGIAEISSTQVCTWHEAIDEGGLPHPTVAAEQGYLAL